VTTVERRGTSIGGADGTDDPDRALRQDADELEQRIDRLDERIQESREGLRARQEDADLGDELVGDWEDTDDDAGGEDPSAFDDPETAEDEDDPV
jgi:hypothetical protein